MLEPSDKLAEFEEKGDYYGRIALQERLKTMPLGAVWDYYCLQEGVPAEDEIYSRVTAYEKDVLSSRARGL
jgi:L-rhamnose isomerase